MVGQAEDLARAHHPDVVLLMLGTNDLKFAQNAADGGARAICSAS